MQLYLMRHGEAEDAAMDSPGRALTTRGQTEVERVAWVLRNAGVAQDTQIVSSTFTRARQTAEIVHRVLELPVPIEVWEGITPYDAAHPVIPRLNLETRNLIVVAHNPLIRMITSLLLTQNEAQLGMQFVKGGCVNLQRLPHATAEPLAPNWKLLWYLTPGLVI